MDINKNKAIPNKNLSLKWFNAYVNFLLPLAIIGSIPQIIKVIKFAIHIIPNSPYELRELGYIVWYILLFILIIVLFIGLRKRKLWAWKLNFIYLILPVFLPYLYALSMGHRVSIYGYAIYWFLFFLIIWVIPNWIYFKKRKYLFS